MNKIIKEGGLIILLMFSFNSQEGIIPVSFSGLPPLEEDKIYKWSLIVDCQDLGYLSIPLPSYDNSPC